MGTVRFFRHSTQLFRYYIPTEYVLLAVIEFFVLMLALYLALETRFNGLEWQEGFGAFLPKAILFAFLMQLSLVAFGVYQRQTGRFMDALMLRIASGLLLGMIPIGMSFYFVPQFFLGRGVLMLSVVYGFLFITIIRLFFRRVVKERNMWSRILVIGAGRNAELVDEERAQGNLNSLNIVGYVPMNGDHSEKLDQLIELDKPLVQLAQELDIDEIVLAVDDRRRAGMPSRDLLDCKMSGIDILDLVTFFERRSSKIRLDVMYPSWLYLTDGFRESTFRSVIKRLVDITAVTLIMPVALPFILITGIAVFIDGRGRGSIFYTQTRVKQDGRLFKIYKFRSMVANAEKDGVAVWAKKNDARVTPVGAVIRKSRLDELPQLFNVLKGDMSFVGPRPERPEFVDRLADVIPYYHERHRVKPGLTGWAQIRYPYGESEADSLEKLQYDLYYVKNFSIFLDVLILLQTAEVVLLGKGAR